MGSSFLKNIIGVHLSDDQMNDIPYPRFELALHITTKTVQAGAFLGMFIAAPLVTAFSTNHDCDTYKRLALKYGLTGSAIGAGLGPVLTLAKLRSTNEQGAYDRSLSIRYNRNQVRCDRFSYLGAALGSAAVKYCQLNGGKCPLTDYQMEEGVLVGSMAGMLSAFTFNMIHGDKHS